MYTPNIRLSFVGTWLVGTAMSQTNSTAFIIPLFYIIISCHYTDITISYHYNEISMGGLCHFAGQEINITSLTVICKFHCAYMIFQTIAFACRERKDLF